jgi:lysyl-tRNA synthetase class 2
MSEQDTPPTPSEELLYEKNRLEEFKQLNVNAYPHKFTTTISLQDYIKKYHSVENGSRHRELVECVAGRVILKRNSGKKLYFYTIQSNGFQLQYLADSNEYENKEQFLEINKLIHNGDIVGTRGFVGKSLRNELSIYPLELVLLSPCYKYLPKQHFGLVDQETRIKKRYLDMIVNPKMIQTFKTRCQIIKEIRKYLDNRDFIEVETPILSTKVGGAAAKPFVTYHNDLKKEMFLRIAPELYLKQLVIGGMDRVYEIGKQFRNESIDSNHLSSFDSLEFYMAYADYHDLMTMCEEMLSSTVLQVHGKLQINYLPTNSNKEVTIDFSFPFKRIDIMQELISKTGQTFPDNLTTDDANKFLDQLCAQNNIECGAPRTTCRLLDKLIGHYIEPQCLNPTFLINHPLIMSPLAKIHRTDPRLSERFELFVCGMELCNAYTELNSHVVQEENFRRQQLDKGNGDEEIPLPDEDFIESLKYGLPPTAGFGCGIDRLVMLLTNNSSIREVITFI